MAFIVSYEVKQKYFKVLKSPLTLHITCIFSFLCHAGGLAGKMAQGFSWHYLTTIRQPCRLTLRPVMRSCLSEKANLSRYYKFTLDDDDIWVLRSQHGGGRRSCFDYFPAKLLLKFRNQIVWLGSQAGLACIDVTEITVGNIDNFQLVNKIWCINKFSQDLKFKKINYRAQNWYKIWILL